APWLTPSHDRTSISIHPPIRTNPIPAITLRIFGETKTDSWEPTSTASKLDKTSAPAEAQNTPTRLTFGSAANNNVASCVLSPNSAKNTVTKTDQSDILYSPFIHCDRSTIARLYTAYHMKNIHLDGHIRDNVRFGTSNATRSCTAQYS